MKKLRFRDYALGVCFSCLFGIVLLYTLTYKPPEVNCQGVAIPITQASMDDSKLMKRIIDLKEGESGFIIAEAVFVDENKKLWINPYSMVIEESKVKISKKDGWHVEISDKNLKWLRAPLELTLEDPLRKRLEPIKVLVFK